MAREKNLIKMYKNLSEDTYNFFFLKTLEKTKITREGKPADN